MAKDLVAVTGTYMKDGQEKKEYTKIGVILENDNGEYALLDPAINLAGVMMKQRLANPGKKGDSVMCGIYDRSQEQNANQASQSSQMPPNNGYDDDPGF